MSRSTDRDLMEHARAGDVAAFSELVRKYQPRIFRLAVHMLRDRIEAEDVSQETFIRAYQAIQRFDGRSEPFTWIYRIAVNLSLNILRSRKTARISGNSDDPRLEGFLIEQRPSAHPDPDGEAGQKEMFAALCQCMDALSESLKTTLLLVAIEGLSHDAAGQVLGVPEGTVAWRIHEARRKLREMMAARGFDLEGESA